MKKLVYSICFLLSLSACSDIALRQFIEDLVANANATVYTAGYFTHPTTGNQMPSYWTNTTRTDLTAPDSGAGKAFSISVASSSVYTAGFTVAPASMFNTASFWTNAARTDLTDGTAAANAAAISVYGGNVYIGGFESNGAADIPCYWTNGKASKTPLSLGVDVSGQVSSIFIDSSGFHASGNTDNGAAIMTPCYWIGTAKTALPIPSNTGNGASVFASGETIYTAGFYWDGALMRNVPCLWTNVVQTPLNNSQECDAQSVFVYDGSVYVGGSYFDGSKLVPCYWKDSVRIDLAGDGVHNARVYSIYVFAGTVFAGGAYSTTFGALPEEEYIPCYWRNGQLTDLGGKGVVRSIFVQ